MYNFLLWKLPHFHYLLISWWAPWLFLFLDCCEQSNDEHEQAVLWIICGILCMCSCAGLDENGRHQFICLNTQSLVVGTVWEGLDIQPCWRKSVSARGLCDFKNLWHSQIHLFLPCVCGWDVSSQMLLWYYAYLPTCCHVAHPGHANPLNSISCYKFFQ